MFELVLGIGIFVLLFGVTELMRLVNRERGGLPFTRSVAFIAAALLGVVVGVGVTAVENIIGTPKQHLGSKQSLPPVVQQPLTSTELQKVEVNFGPFKPVNDFTSQTPDTNYPAVLMMRQNGSVDASQQWTVRFTPDWTLFQAPQISALTVQGKYAHFHTEGIPTYSIRCNQPFILEEVPQTVMLIDEQGRQWSISTKQAATLLARVR